MKLMETLALFIAVVIKRHSRINRTLNRIKCGLLLMRHGNVGTYSIFTNACPAAYALAFRASAFTTTLAETRVGMQGCGVQHGVQYGAQYGGQGSPQGRP
jgi:hypothetical protein